MGREKSRFVVIKRKGEEDGQKVAAEEVEEQQVERTVLQASHEGETMS